MPFFIHITRMTHLSKICMHNHKISQREATRSHFLMSSNSGSRYRIYRCCVCVCVRACVCVCVCAHARVFFHSSTVKASSVCKMSKTYLRVRINDLVLWILVDCVMPSSIIAVSENVIFHFQRRKLQPLYYWRENDMM